MKVEISCSITRNFGAEQVTFGASAIFDIKKPDEYRILYDKMYLRISDQFKHYTAEHLPDVPNTGGQVGEGGRQAAGSKHYEDQPCKQLIIAEIKDGKPLYKVKGGDYMAHGVRIWHEVIEGAGLKTGEIGMAGFDLTGWKMRVMLVDGKPKRVVELTRDE